jgi:hypothetical protein
MNDNVLHFCQQNYVLEQFLHICDTLNKKLQISTTTGNLRDNILIKNQSHDFYHFNTKAKLDKPKMCFVYIKK